jgi:hypothetical protein
MRSLRASRVARAAKRSRADAASSGAQSRPAGCSAMQSTGHGATHNSHPEHNDGSTVCMRFCAPRIASTGHAAMHSVQPMHAASSTTATSSGPCAPHAGSSGRAVRPVSAARATMTASPPGGHRLMSAAPVATASAYGRHAAYPQRVHCVCGSTASMRSASDGDGTFTRRILPSARLLDCCELKAAAKEARRLKRCLPTRSLPLLTSIHPSRRNSVRALPAG